MAEQIDELFVKLGLESDEKEFEQANEQFAALRTKALQFGAAIGGIGAASFGLVSNFADRTDELGQFADRMDVSVQFVNQLGFALESVGGSADDAIPSIQNMLSVLQDQDWGQLEGKIESLSAGIDFEELKAAATEADSLREAYVNISEQIQGLSGRKQQRVLEELGITGEQMNLIQLGPEEMRARFQRGSELAPVTDEMTQNARDFERAGAELEASIRGLADEISNELAPALTSSVEGIVKFLQRRKDDITESVTDPVKLFSDVFAGDFSGAFSRLVQRQEEETRERAEALGLEKTEGSSGFDFLKRLWSGPEDAKMPETLPLSPRRGGGVAPDVQSRPDTSMNTGGGNQINFNIDARGATDPEGVALNVERAVNRTLSRYAENAILDLTGSVS